MIPKKYHEFIGSTADLTDSPEDLVKAITDFFWKETRKSLSDMVEPNIFVEGLGTFTVKPKHLQKLKEKHLSILEKYEKRKADNTITFTGFSIIKETEERLRKIQHIEEFIQKELKRKKEVATRREKSNTNIQEHTQDL